MADRLKLAQGLRTLPASARQDLAQREEDIQRGKTVELLRRAGKEMYDNPIVNTAIGFTPVLGDVQAAGETMAALNRGAPWQETAGYAAGMLPFVPMIGKTVWHGSPHTFEKFDLSKIGTGEGAQAYGHGLYLAESPDVAGSYKSAGDMGWFEREADKALFNKDIDEAIESTRTELERVKQIPKATAATQNLQGVLNVLEARKSGAGEAGNLYKVDLPDEQIAKMLDWDKPLSEQAPFVQESLNKAISFMPEERQALFRDYPLQDFQLGKDLKEMIGERYMAQAGIPGIQYLDQASRDPSQRFIARSPHGGESVFNSAQEAQDYIANMAKHGHEFEYVDPNLTRNYVVFSDEIPKIIERNNQPVGMFK